MKQIPFTRREFLRFSGSGLGLLAFNAYAPAFLTRSVLQGAPLPERDRSILVLVQLAGGNDGLNTVIPFANERYYQLRPTLGIRRVDALSISNELGFHPSMKGMADLLQQGKLSLLQNVGYPNPNRSHFRSMEIWETASDSERIEHTGWVGRFFDHACCGLDPNTPRAVHLSNEVPQSFLAEDIHPVYGFSQGWRGRGRENERVKELLDQSLVLPGADDPQFNFLQHSYFNALATEARVLNLLNRDRSAADYPNTAFARSLQNIASLIGGGLETRVYFANLGGFDTHVNQEGNHARLLATLSDGLAAFQRDLEQRGLEEQVITLTFSEFGRRPDENGNRGTDHGTSAPLFIMGKPVQSGILGHSPDLSGNPRAPQPFDFDFRQVYATILEDWLGASSASILGSEFDKLPFLAGRSISS